MGISIGGTEIGGSGGDFLAGWTGAFDMGGEEARKGERGQERAREAQAAAGELIDQLNTQSQQLATMGGEAWGIYKQNLQRYEAQYGADSKIGKFLASQATPTEAAYETAAGKSRADVESGLAQSQQQINERARVMGVDPSDPAAQAAAAGMGVLGAGARAGAANQAREQVKNTATQVGMGLTQLGQSAYLNPAVGGMGLQGVQGAGQLSAAGAGALNEQMRALNEQAGQQYAREQGDLNRTFGLAESVIGGQGGVGAKALSGGLSFKNGGLVVRAKAGGRMVDHEVLSEEREDRIDAELTPDEYVVTAPAVKHIGIGALDRLTQAGEEGKDVKITIAESKAPRRIAGLPPQKIKRAALGGQVEGDVGESVRGTRIPTFTPPLGNVASVDQIQIARGGLVSRVASSMSARRLR